VLALISPPLQLLAVIIEALQAHNSIMHAHPVGSKGHKGHGGHRLSKLIRSFHPDKVLHDPRHIRLGKALRHTPAPRK